MFTSHKHLAKQFNNLAPWRLSITRKGCGTVYTCLTPTSRIILKRRFTNNNNKAFVEADSFHVSNKLFFDLFCDVLLFLFIKWINLSSKFYRWLWLIIKLELRYYVFWFWTLFILHWNQKRFLLCSVYKRLKGIFANTAPHWRKPGTC